MRNTYRPSRWLALVPVLVLVAGSCDGQAFEAGPLGAVEVAPGEDIQIRSIAVLTGLGELGAPDQRGVALALAGYGPIKGHNVSMGVGLDSLCTAEGGRAAADTVTGDPRVVGAIGTSCSVAAAEASPILAALNRELLVWERTYNTVRPHQALGYLTPAQAVAQWQTQRKEPECH